MKLKRLLYLGYYIKQLDYSRFRKFVAHAQSITGKSKLALWSSAILSVFRFNISPEEYFLFRFYERSPAEQATFAGTGYMYEYQLRMNPASERGILENKLRFLVDYAPFIRHEFASIDTLTKNLTAGKNLLNNPSGKVVLKHTNGQCGRGIEVRNSADFDLPGLIHRLHETGNDFVEEFVSQHDELMKLSPSGLNTVRIITQIDSQSTVEILGARLRITVDSVIDNLAAGNLAAPVDLITGIVTGPGVYSDITKQDEHLHPITGLKIEGFRIPYWSESLNMVIAAAKLHPENRSIGWDVAITDKGPELIEGNHDWCKLLWQLPVKKGLKPMLEKYRNDT